MTPSLILNGAANRLPDEPQRVGRYAVDDAFEGLVARGNDRLEELELELVRETAPPTRPFVVVCGAPRSGTTLLAQVLARTRAFNYVTNFMARFWKAPYFAGMLERQMGLRHAVFEENITSTYGVTPQPNEPHEFGFFWNRWLRFEGETHRVAMSEMTADLVKGLQNELWRIISLYPLPFFIKNNIVGLNAAAMVQIFGDVRFVVIRRDPLYTAQSIYEGRREMLGTVEPFWSLRPSRYAAIREMDPLEQIAHQIAGSYADVYRDLATTCAPYIELDYESICCDPASAVEKVGQLLDIPVDAEIPAGPPDDLRCRNDRRLSAELMRQLSGALREAGV